jgi:hypothetical protein
MEMNIQKHGADKSVLKSEINVVRGEVLMAAVLKMAVFWFVVLCFLVEVY